MLTAVLALSSAFAYSVHDYLMMRVVRATPVLTALFWVQLVGAAVLLPLWLAVDELPAGAAAWRAAGLAALTGPIEILALAFLLKGLSVGKLSIVGPLAALGGGFGAAFAVALGEPVSGLAAVGLPLAVVGAVLASVERGGEDERAVKATAGAGWALLCALTWGVEPVIIGAATDRLSSLTVLTVGRATSLLVLAPFTALLGGFALQRVFRRRVAASGAIDVAGFAAWIAATALGPVATASVLVAQAGTMSALLGAVVLRERPSRVQVAGIAATVTAVTLLAMSEGG